MVNIWVSNVFFSNSSLQYSPKMRTPGVTPRFATPWRSRRPYWRSLSSPSTLTRAGSPSTKSSTLRPSPNMSSRSVGFSYCIFVSFVWFLFTFVCVFSLFFLYVLFVCMIVFVVWFFLIVLFMYFLFVSIFVSLFIYRCICVCVYTFLGVFYSPIGMTYVFFSARYNGC